MENVAMVNYSFKEKYLQIEPEFRIRRYQYFVRCLIPAILLFLVMIFILPVLSMGLLSIFGIGGFAAMMYVGGIVMILSQVLYIIVFYKIGISLITKRCHDFGSDGKIAITIFKAQMLITVLNIILMVLTFTGIDIPGTSIMGPISQIVGICGLIMGIFLLFRPGSKEDNQYGKNPINTKVGFLG